MGVPSPRTPVRIARGTKSVLETNKGALEEGEICYATDENMCYVKEGSNLESVTKTLLDEDNMSSDSATQAPTQQSVKAYVDTADATKAALAGATFTGNVKFDSDVTFDNTDDANADMIWSRSQGQLQFRNIQSPNDVSSGIKFITTLDGSSWDQERGSIHLDSNDNWTFSTNQIIWLSAVDSVKIYNGSKSSASFDVDEGVELYYNNGKKFETINTGIQVYGDLVFEGSSADAHETTFTVTDPTADRTITFPNATGTVALGAIGTDIQAYDADTAKLDVDQAWTGAQRGTIVDTPAMTGDITIDMAASNNYKATLTGNAVFKNPTNQVAGQSGSIFITQDGTGSRTASWEANWKWVGGTAPTLSTAAGSVDRIDYIILASTKIHAVASLDVK